MSSVGKADFNFISAVMGMYRVRRLAFKALYILPINFALTKCDPGNWKPWAFSHAVMRASSDPSGIAGSAEDMDPDAWPAPDELDAAARVFLAESHANLILAFCPKFSALTFGSIATKAEISSVSTAASVVTQAAQSARVVTPLEERKGNQEGTTLLDSRKA